MSGYDVALFDNDGVLVEPPTAETKVRAIRRAFDDVGVPDPDPGHVDAVAAGATADALAEIAAAYDVDADAFWRAREDHDDELQRADFRNGTRVRYDDVRALERVSQPCGVVSNNHHSTVAFVLDYFDLGNAFETYYGREMSVESLDRKKPNTHYLERALRDLDADDAVYVGDRESDVVAADRAGLDSVFLRRAHCRDADLDATPTYEVDTLHDVADLLDG